MSLPGTDPNCQETHVLSSQVPSVSLHPVVTAVPQVPRVPPLYGRDTWHM